MQTGNTMPKGYVSINTSEIIVVLKELVII